MRRWEYTGDGSDKFWEAAAEGAEVTVRYGRTGTAGRTQVKSFGSAAEADRHLARAIGEKERKGYREAGAPTPPAAPAPAASPVTAPAPAPAGLPDEDAFTLPATWRRHLHPRRGGVRRAATPAADAGARAGQLLTEAAGWIDQALANPTSDPALVEAARAHRRGGADPLGAAVLAALAETSTADLRVFADDWATAHGLPFAARAAVELRGVYATWDFRGAGRRNIRVNAQPQGQRWSYGDSRRATADRVRALLAATDEHAYRATVAALAPYRERSSRAGRIVVSYLVPTETGWVDECLAKGNAAAGQGGDGTLRTLLLCSLSTPGHLDALGGKAELGWQGWSLATLATLAEGVGPGFVPLLAERLTSPAWLDGDAVKLICGVLAQLPSDEAFAALLTRVDDRHAQPHLLAASRRYPVRALRLLAEASLGPDAKRAAPARQLLVTHVHAHRDLAAAALPGLPERFAALVAPLADPGPPVEELPAGALPALLAAPPWTRRRARPTPHTVDGLLPIGGPAVHWLPGEQESWATARTWYSRWRGSSDWDEALLAQQQGRLRPHELIGLFANGPVEPLRPSLAHWAPELFWDGDGPGTYRPIVARYGLDALPLARQAATHHPGTLAGLLLPFLELGCARLMAEWLVRLKSVHATAREWFARHGTGAARLLVPDAVGPAGPARRHAEQALLLVAAAHGAEAVHAVAAEYGAEAAAAVRELVSSDPLENSLPARVPVPGDWLDVVLLPRIAARQGGALPVGAVRHLVTVLALSRPGAPYPGLATVREFCDPGSLAGFAWALFEQWRAAGMPPKDAWALHALGPLGDDAVVRLLTPVVRGWPGEGVHQRAVEGLDVLTAIGTDVALLHLHDVARRSQFKALRARAQERIAEVAAALGLTDEQLADRLVPDFGLDDEGRTVIDYGPRRFTVGFDFDGRLRPYVLDEDGRRRGELPAPGARDDAEAAGAGRARFTALKKEVRAAADSRLRRLEAALVAQRSWTAAEFRALLAQGPLLRNLLRGLVWLSESRGVVTAFQVTGPGTLADAAGAAVALPEDASVRLAHPLHLGDGGRAAWSAAVAVHGIPQPFPQLDRPVHSLTPAEATGYRLTRFEGRTVPVGRLLGLRRRGWERGVPQDAGVERWISRRLGPGRYLVIALDNGIAAGVVDEFPEQTLTTVWLAGEPGDHHPLDDHPLRLGDLDPVIASEVLADLAHLTAPAPAEAEGVEEAEEAEENVGDRFTGK
ncbi:DUF4132 domain-containing protein [Kitasatospora sp. NPDC057223]|uniref:DUF4132 domain-containing protein n=1 Tax=Kitasatospora sp. NPDC057223 TaxID=3346055 RepID=UPI0036277C4D